MVPNDMTNYVKDVYYTLRSNFEMLGRANGSEGHYRGMVHGEMVDLADKKGMLDPVVEALRSTGGLTPVIDQLYRASSDAAYSAAVQQVAVCVETLEIPERQRKAIGDSLETLLKPVRNAIRTRTINELRFVPQEEMIAAARKLLLDAGQIRAGGAV
jgi:hypothetical protein